MENNPDINNVKDKTSNMSVWLYLLLGFLLGVGVTLLTIQLSSGGSFLQGYISPATLKSITSIKSFDPEPEPPGYVALPTSR